MLYILLSAVPFVTMALLWIMRFISGVTASCCYRIREFDGSLLETGGSFPVFAAVWTFLTVLICARPEGKAGLRKAAAVFSAMMLMICLAPKGDNAVMYIIPYGEKTATAIEIKDGESVLIDCPDAYSINYLENPETPYRIAILTDSAVSQVLKKESIRTIIVPDRLFTQQTRVNLIKRAQESAKTVIFLKDYEKIQVGEVIVEYFPLEVNENVAAVRVSYNNKTLISLQGFDGDDIAALGSDNIRLVSDYVILPFTAHNYDGNLFSGKILEYDLK